LREPVEAAKRLGVKMERGIEIPDGRAPREAQIKLGGEFGRIDRRAVRLLEWADVTFARQNGSGERRDRVTRARNDAPARYVSPDARHASTLSGGHEFRERANEITNGGEF
jgi:hypothetical protein